MICYTDGKNVTKLINRATINGSKKSCARTLSLNIAQSPIDGRIPMLDLSVGKQIQFSANGMEFFGVTSSVTRSTASNTVDLTAQDMGLYLKRNSVTCKINGKTPREAAKLLCKGRGIPTGHLESCGGFTFKRNFSGATLYSAIMTGYTLASEKNGVQYQMVFDGSLMCVVPRGVIIGGIVKPKVNLKTAAYSESIENATNKVYMYSSDGAYKGSVTGDTSYGIMGQALTITEQRGKEYAEKIIRDNKKSRSGTIEILGNAECITGNAILVYEPYTKLYGKFYIDADTHTWQGGQYSTKLTLSFENTMDAQTVGTEIAKSEKKKKEKKDANSHSGMYHVGPHGDVIYTYP